MMFVQKHKKVFIFGALLALLFGLITALSTRNGGTEIRLTEFITRDRASETPSVITSTPFPTALEPTEPAQQVTEEPATPPAQPDILIRFVEGVGWTPSSRNAQVGQKVVWQNDSGAEITVMELFPRTTHLASGVALAPGQSTEVVLNAGGLITFRELNSQSTARVLVAE